MDEQFLIETLRALFDLSRGGRPDTGAVARRLGVRPTDVAHALVELDRRGLVDKGRARLTFRGLARAAAIERLQPHRPSPTLPRQVPASGWKATSSVSISERPTPSSRWPTTGASESFPPTAPAG